MEWEVCAAIGRRAKGRSIARRAAGLLLLAASVIVAAPWSASEVPVQLGLTPHLNSYQRALKRRVESLKRQLPHGIPPQARTRAIEQMRSIPQIVGPVGGWTFIGPQPITNGQGLTSSGFCGPPPRIDVSGRVSAIAFGASPATIYVGAADGGVWKSTDAGASFAPLTDSQASLAVGSIAVVPGANPDLDLIYVGTGEGNNACDNEFGQGVLRSADGGATWTQVGDFWLDRLSFAKITVSPSNPDVLYGATTFGATNGAASECLNATTLNSGLFKSTNGGVDWTLLSGSGGLPASASYINGSAYDVKIDPTDSNVIFAAIACDNGCADGGIFKSVDAGASWNQLVNGLPVGGRRFAISISPNGQTLYIARALNDSTFDRVYRSIDGGASFNAAGTLPTITCLTEDQEFYDLALAMDPANPLTVYLGLSGIYKSIDGGASFTYIGAGAHPDSHAIEVNAAGVWVGNDGGIAFSANGGASWDNSFNDRLGITQFQAIGLPPTGATPITGGTQDNGTNAYSGSLSWAHSDDGDGGFALIDPQNTAIFFDEHGDSFSSLTLGRSTSAGALGSYTTIAPPAGDEVQFYAPFTQDPSNGQRILFGTRRVWESCAVSPSLACNGAVAIRRPGPRSAAT